MEVRTCRKCGRLFNYLFGANLCPGCKNELEKDYERTRDFIRDNPGASLQLVSEECEVTVNQIEKWVRDGRLEFTKASGITVVCEKCGQPIRTGRFCEACKNNLAEMLGSALDKPKAKNDEKEKKKERGSANKMRFLKQ